MYIENENLRIELNNVGCLAILDKKTGVAWKNLSPGFVTLRNDINEEKIPLCSGICSAKISSVKVNSTDYSHNCDELNVEFNGATGKFVSDEKFSCFFRILPKDKGFELRLESVETELEFISLEYPAHTINVKSGSEQGYTVIPVKQGVIVPSRLDTGYMRYMNNLWRNICDIEKYLEFDSGPLNMPWFGAHKGESSIFIYSDTPTDMSLHVVCNSVVNDSGYVVSARHCENPGTRMSSLSPIFESSMGKLGYPRSVYIQFLNGGYVEMAKLYLEFAKKNGRYVSLREKIIRNPMIEKMIGAPDIKIYIYTNRINEPYLRAWCEPVLDGYSCVHTTFKQVSDFLDKLKADGIDNALILLGGWNRAGYDNGHVDMWPPAEGAGGAEDLKKLSLKARSLGYILSLHDNYQDYYLNAPSYNEECLVKKSDGSVQTGGIWDGGQCRIICSHEALDLARSNVDKVQNGTEITSYYLDTTIAAKLYECHDKNHPQTRIDDKQSRYTLLTDLQKLGLIVGTEGGNDWAVPVCTYFEGLPGSGTGTNAGVEASGFGISAPLFYLVYHDSVICYWQHGQPYGREDHINHMLFDLLNAQPSSWSIIYEQFGDMEPLILDAYRLLGRFHTKTAHCQMVNHEYLKKDFTVQKTVFSDGSEVIVNFDILSFSLGDNKIPPKGFLLKMNGEDQLIGCFDRTVKYL
ncbi:MAG: glycoside hydrolase [Treponema sp.]|nr:glycoside hydrolase [Treponema sp.]